MTATTWYEASLVYLRALDIPPAMTYSEAGIAVDRKFPFGRRSGLRAKEWNRAVGDWLDERRAAVAARERSEAA